MTEQFDSSDELSAAEIAAIFSNLAKGCEKQRLGDESAAFGRLAEYYTGKAAEDDESSFTQIQELLKTDLGTYIPEANDAAAADADRGAKRALVWTEKVSLVGDSLLSRFATGGEAMLVGVRIFVCEICGFVYIGEAPPEICPICKVPGFKIAEVKRS